MKTDSSSPEMIFLRLSPSTHYNSSLTSSGAHLAQPCFCACKHHPHRPPHVLSWQHPSSPPGLHFTMMSNRPTMWDSCFCPSLPSSPTPIPLPPRPSLLIPHLIPSTALPPHTENDQPSLVWFDRGKFYLTFEGKFALHRGSVHEQLHSSEAHLCKLCPSSVLFIPYLLTFTEPPIICGQISAFTFLSLGVFQSSYLHWLVFFIEKPSFFVHLTNHFVSFPPVGLLASLVSDFPWSCQSILWNKHAFMVCLSLLSHPAALIQIKASLTVYWRKRATIHAFKKDIWNKCAFISEVVQSKSREKCVLITSCAVPSY